MYRRLVPLPVVAFLSMAIWQAYGPAAAGVGAGTAAVAAAQADTYEGASLALHLFLQNAWPLALGVGLAWAAAFHPARRPTGREAVLRLLAALTLGCLAAAVVYRKAVAAGSAAAILAAQVKRPPLLLILASQAPHGLLELTALALVLAAPLYWLVRTAQVFSLPRSTFEAWAEVRRLALPGVVLLAAAALVETYLTPITTAWFLR